MSCRTRARILTLLAPVVVLAACGIPAQQAQPVEPGQPAPATTSAAPGVTVTDTDNGRTVSVARGARVDVLLHGSTGSQWAQVRADGSALTPAPSDRGSVPAGVTGASYTAARAGTERLSSSRAACPSASPGAFRCGAVLTFTVTIEVH